MAAFRVSPLLVPSLAVLLLASCAPGQPVTPQPPDTTSAGQAFWLDGAMQGRLARVELDVATIKTQMAHSEVQAEKMAALQGKLLQLVEELQRMDAENTAAVKMSEAPVSAPAPVPVSASAPVPKGAVTSDSKPAPVVSSVPAPALKPAAAMAPTPIVKPAVSAARPAASSVPEVSALRFGQHGEKTRLVLDLSAPAVFTQDLDNAEKILIVEIKGAAWKMSSPAPVAVKSPVVASYLVQTAELGGQRLVLQLKKPVRVVASTSLKPSGDRGNRILIDLAPSAG